MKIHHKIVFKIKIHLKKILIKKKNILIELKNQEKVLNINNNLTNYKKNEN